MRISDWSSDVCSSDLGHGDDGQSRLLPSPHRDATVGMARGVLDEVAKRLREIVGVDARQRAGGNLDVPVEPAAGGPIGNASCRERVCLYVWISVVAVSLHKNLPVQPPTVLLLK